METINKISQDELQQRMNWTLNQKIDHSLYIIESFINKYPNSKVAFSGGLDSTVMLYLVRMIDKNREGIFSNTTNELSEILDFVKDTENIKVLRSKTTFKETVSQYGFPLISKLVARQIHDLKYPTKSNEATRLLYSTGIKRDGTKSKSFKLAEKWKHLIDQPFDISIKCCDILKKQPMSVFSETGVFIGTMAENSGTRKMSYLKTGCINEAENKCMPLSIFTKQDNWNIIKQFNIPYSTIYNKGETNTGCAYCGIGCQFDKTRFLRLKEREPKRFDYMMNLENNGITFKEALNITFKI